MRRAITFLSLALFGAARRLPKLLDEHHRHPLETLFFALDGLRYRPMPAAVATRRNAPVLAGTDVRELKDKKDFETAVTQDSLVVVDYGNTWCGPCKFMDSRFKKMSEDYPNVEFLKVTGDENLELKIVMALQGVKVLPTFDLFRSGKKLATVAGAKEKELKIAIEAHMR
mmetsp:Transcript_23120/g.36953  ORF Transcript_23120/g.36953 Transcript_23120/m.36953 type:complete len:170 (-) Transcript_23120:200-709(-)